MSQIELINHPDYIAFIAPFPCRVLSSAVLNGGLTGTRSLLNLRVDKHQPPPWPSPRDTLSAQAQKLALPQPVTGMMTAASMKSLGTAQADDGGLMVQCWVTAGLSNLLRAGDPADGVPVPGTINIWLYINQPLTDAALAEALILLTESKVTAVRDAGLQSPVSHLPASGTGTDSHAVICPQSSADGLDYCGKHPRAGELIGRTVLSACQQSISLCQRAIISGDT